MFFSVVVEMGEREIIRGLEKEMRDRCRYLERWWW